MTIHAKTLSSGLIRQRPRHKAHHPLAPAPSPSGFREEHRLGKARNHVGLKPQRKVRLSGEELLACDEEVDKHLERAEPLGFRTSGEADAVGALDGGEEVGDEVGFAEAVLDFGAAEDGRVVGGHPEALVANGFENVGEVVSQLGGGKVGEVGNVEVVAQVIEAYAGGGVGFVGEEGGIDFTGVDEDEDGLDITGLLPSDFDDRHRFFWLLKL